MEAANVREENVAAAPGRAAAGDGSGRHYQRYHIETREVADVEPWPSRFKVRVGKVGLARLLLKELIHTRGDLDVVTSRPCLYGVFSGPVGGFAPREEKCVGCLRCMTEHPDFVSIEPNPARQRLGDSYFTAAHVNAVSYEATSGRIPVKGAGYRGRFGGEGWDGMWTDMSEIVRPTRDGIHGREFISTVVDVGARLPYVPLDGAGAPSGPFPHTFSLPLPLLFDAPAAAANSPALRQILSEAAAAAGTLVLLPLADVLADGLVGAHIAPLVPATGGPALDRLPFTPQLLVLDGGDAAGYAALQQRFPETVICLRIPFGDAERLLRYVTAGVSVFQLTADYHGRSGDGTFIFDAIRAAHLALVAEGVRDQITLLGSGGIIAAEHVPKAIIAGLDAVALDTPLLVALQARFDGDFTSGAGSACRLPHPLPVAWGRQRLLNLLAAWRDQLLEVLGAMGLREVRRLRGEMGRAMFQADLEREAFAGIEGY